MSQSKVTAEILDLPVSERIELVGQIWDSISQESLPAIGDINRKILEERIAEHQTNPDSGITLGELQAELLRK